METVKITDYLMGFKAELGGVMATVASMDDSVVFFYGSLPSSTAEARAFAQRIIAVADAVEAELKGGK